MSRTARNAPGGLVYHALNRAAARLPLFHKDGDYDAFERIMVEAMAQHPTRLLAYCLMPNHWHMVLWPRQDGEMSAFLRWLSLTHAMRWHAHYHTAGTGHLYQNRFKHFPVQSDDHHFLSVCRYVERNALRANLVPRAEHWRWCSLWRRREAWGDDATRALLHPWPVDEPADWVEIVNRPQSDAEVEALRRSLRRGRPYGSEPWQAEVAGRLGLQATLRPRGRPRKDGSPTGPSSGTATRAAADPQN